MNWLTGGKQGEVKKLITQLTDSSTRERAATELIKLDADAAPLLVDALQIRDPNLLRIYQQILARIPSASSDLIDALKTKHPIIRASAADVLGLRKDSAAVPALLDALKGEYYTVRARAAIALGRIGDKQAVTPMLSLLKDPEREVRKHVIQAMGELKDQRTLPALQEIAADRSDREFHALAKDAIEKIRS